MAARNVYGFKLATLVRIIGVPSLALSLAWSVSSTASAQIYVNSEAGLQSAINGGNTNIILSSNITLTSTLTIAVGSLGPGVYVTINDNGHSLSGTNGIAITNNSQVALVGNNNYSGGTTVTGQLELGTSTLGTGNAGTGGIVFTNGGLYLNMNSPYALSNPVSGSGTVSIIVNDTGTTTFTTANSYAGQTDIYSNLNVSGSATLGGSSAEVVFLGGTLDLGGTTQTTGDVSIVDAAATGNTIQNGTIIAPEYTATNTTGNAIVSANLGGSTSNLIEDGAGGTLTLSGNNSYGGGTSVEAGTLTVSGSGTLGATTGPLDVSNTNTGAGTAVVLNLSTTSPTTTGSLSGSISTPSSGTNTATINNGGQLFTVNQTTSAIYAGTIAGSGGFTLGPLSTGTLTLTGANTYTGNTMIDSGTLKVSGSGTLGSGNYNIYLYGGTLDLGGTRQNPINVYIYDAASSGNTIQNGALSGPAVSYYAYNTSGNAIITANLGGASFFQAASGTSTLAAINTYKFYTNISSGTLDVTGSGTLGSSNASLLMEGGLLDLGGTSQTTGEVDIDIAVASGNTIQNGTLTAPDYVVTNTSGNAIITANLAGSSAPLSVSGGGTVTLSGANIYGGSTTISSGMLIVGTSTKPSSLSGTSSVMINNSGSLLFGNNGSIKSTAPVTVSGGGMIGFTPGSTPIAATAGGLTLQSGAAIIDFGSGSRNNTLTFTSLLNLASSATINVFDWSNTSGNTYGNGGNSTTDSSSNTSQDHFILSGGAGTEATALSYIDFYSGNTTSSGFLGTGGEVAFGASGAVEIVPTPEPSTIFAGVCLLGLVGYGNRRSLIAREA